MKRYFFSLLLLLAASSAVLAHYSPTQLIASLQTPATEPSISLPASSIPNIRLMAVPIAKPAPEPVSESTPIAPPMAIATPVNTLRALPNRSPQATLAQTSPPKEKAIKKYTTPPNTKLVSKSSKKSTPKPQSKSASKPQSKAAQITDHKTTQKPNKSSSALHNPLIRSPQFASAPNSPRYPKLARKRGWAGKVIVEIQLGSAGEQLSRKLVQSSGHSVLDESALTAVKSWRFKPYRIDGLALAHRVRVPVDFKLQ